MAYFTGTVAAKDLFSTIVSKITQVQAGESAAWWVKESSLDADGAYTSRGSSGNERIVLVFREGTIGFKFTVGYARDYTPAAINTAGAFDTLETQDIQYFTAAESQFAMVTYDISVTKDRVIIHVQGDKLVATWQNTVTFLGMPIKYDPNDRKFVVRATSENGNVVANVCRVLENSVGVVSQNYNWYYVASPGNPSWGNTYFLETFHIGNGAEGLRGELDGLYGSHPDGLVDGDEIDVAGTKFKIIQRRSNGTNEYPRTTYFMRKS